MASPLRLSSLSLKRLIASVVATLATAVAALTISVSVISPAAAIPDGGAGSNTAGTNASASPRTLTAGATLRFTVSGFPAGEVVYIKIDDGVFCSAKAVHGACVVHQQRLSANGSASGSFVLPSDLKPGRHWLRFLASKEMTDKSGNFLGVKGYTTRRGVDFTIVTGVADSAASGTGAGAVTGTTGTANPVANGNSDVALAAGQTLVVQPPAGSKVAGAETSPEAPAEAGSDPLDENSSMSATERAEIEAAVDAALAEPASIDQNQAASTANDGAEDDAEDGAAGFPWIGAAGLIMALAAATALALRTRRRA